MKNKSILGCMGRNLIVNAYRYKEDPEELLDKGDFAGYDRASQQAEIAYERVNVDSGRWKKAFIQMRILWVSLSTTVSIIRIPAAC